MLIRRLLYLMHCFSYLVHEKGFQSQLVTTRAIIVWTTISRDFISFISFQQNSLIQDIKTLSMLLTSVSQKILLHTVCVCLYYPFTVTADLSSCGRHSWLSLAKTFSFLKRANTLANLFYKKQEFLITLFDFCYNYL